MSLQLSTFPIRLGTSGATSLARRAECVRGRRTLSVAAVTVNSDGSITLTNDANGSSLARPGDKGVTAREIEYPLDPQ